MITLEPLLDELHRIRQRDLYFEAMRQIKDRLIDDFPLDTSLWMYSTDLTDAMMQLEQGYRRIALVKGEGQ
jgi:hypothetical protein